jgi:hypothetical protein
MPNPRTGCIHCLKSLFAGNVLFDHSSGKWTVNETRGNSGISPGRSTFYACLATKAGSVAPLVTLQKVGRPAEISRLAGGPGKIGHRFQRLPDGSGRSTSVIARIARITWARFARWGASPLRRIGGAVAPELPRITHLATAGKHRHQQEEQNPQSFHPAGLLSWQSSSIIKSWQSTEIVRHNGAHATPRRSLRLSFCLLPRAGRRRCSG